MQVPASPANDCGSTSGMRILLNGLWASMMPPIRRLGSSDDMTEIAIRGSPMPDWNEISSKSHIRREKRPRCATIGEVVRRQTARASGLKRTAPCL